MKKISSKKTYSFFPLIFSVLILFTLGFILGKNSIADKARAQGVEDSVGIKSSAIAPGSSYNYIDNYNFSNGILVYTDVEAVSLDAIGNIIAYKGSATVGGPERDLLYKLIISNPNKVNQKTNLKFTLPKGYTFNGMVSGSEPSAGSIVTGPGDIIWSDYDAPGGESTVSFKVKVP